MESKHEQYKKSAAIEKHYYDDALRDAHYATKQHDKFLKKGEKVRASFYEKELDRDMYWVKKRKHIASFYSGRAKLFK